ncbi:hypothetical protein Lal_00004200 [Lupinus albus]|uniref:Ribulose bisphosphate carboxylase large chain n=1 Tax=Lupinus albus TaxID=3870 RepID=A0A6A5P9T7_LUPAL|nr:putative ribulose-bisphosphate carboxylase [Lupinus albus]KAF1894276.1 hypothetical protein Lal_00004200 [Lupinus albus]
MSCRERYMSPQIEIKASVGLKVNVKDYKLTNTLDSEIKDSDILAAFVTPQLGVPAEEAGVVVAVESSTCTWTTV